MQLQAVFDAFLFKNLHFTVVIFMLQTVYKRFPLNEYIFQAVTREPLCLYVSVV